MRKVRLEIEIDSQGLRIVDRMTQMIVLHVSAYQGAIGLSTIPHLERFLHTLIRDYLVEGVDP